VHPAAPPPADPPVLAGPTGPTEPTPIRRELKRVEVTVPVCLSIGSSDSSGGAGIQGDVKAFASVGCYAATVIVGVTVQTPDELLARHSLPVEAVRSQLRVLLDQLPIAAIKIGTTWSPGVLEVLGRELRPSAEQGVPIVVDPVMVTASGGWIPPIESTTAAVNEYLTPLATVLTPNRREAEILADATGTPTDRRLLAQRLVTSGAAAAIVTPGERESGDWFFDGTCHVHISGDRHRSTTDHGAGCAHSSVLAGLMAHGWSLLDAARGAHRRAAQGVLRGSTTVGRNRHPVDLLGIPERVPVPDTHSSRPGSG
jgi:hydroxymethylpyrimidine/phosphomethylpyrimidine kinase